MAWPYYLRMIPKTGPTFWDHALKIVPRIRAVERLIAEREIRHDVAFDRGFPSTGIDQSRVEAFLQAMQQFGWNDSRNIRFDIRFGAVDPETNRKRAEEMVALAPAIIVAFGSTPVAALL